ncbi:Rieske (2Fe-2S) protein [Streptomyces diastatochromogenes]|nr:Rieske (2Fe-2S) protein [Streptomyces diastatochromogenes]
MRRGHTRALTEGPSPADAHEPVLPYPDGWFSVAFSSEVVRGALLTRPLQGEDVVLYRLRDGEVRAVRPYCPHLGAHLGLGALEGDELLCPSTASPSARTAPARGRGTARPRRRPRT